MIIKDVIAQLLLQFTKFNLNFSNFFYRLHMVCYFGLSESVYLEKSDQNRNHI